jgi:hypothetical protein
LIIAFLTILFMMVSRWEEKQVEDVPATATTIEVPAPPANSCIWLEIIQYDV